MNYQLILCLLVIYFVAVIYAGEQPKNKDAYIKPNNRRPKDGYKVKEKDLIQKDKEAKQKWINHYHPQKELHNSQQQQSDDWGDDMMQKPIDEPPRRTNRDLGEMCTYSRDCGSGCCLLDRDTKIRSCQPKSTLGEKCSAAQIKADLYVDFCPCQSGIDFCKFPDAFCTK